jgi:hypothetical protein
LKTVFFIFLSLISGQCFGQVSPNGCDISGALVNQGPNGCGNAGNYCDLASLFVPAFSPTTCGTFTSSGSSAMNLSSTFILPAGCTASVIMEFKPRNYYGGAIAQNSTGCSNSGMDGGDGMSISCSGCAIASQGSTVQTSNSPTCGAYPALGTYTTASPSLTTGCSNSSGTVAMVVTGGTCIINGISNRADEIVTFTINMSGTCGPSCSAVLPVELIDFFARQQSGKVSLTWKVASEKDVRNYQIDRSRDGLSWQRVSETPPYGKGGINSYQVIDDFPESGINYYRLSEVETDYKMHVKKIISVFINQPVSYQIIQTETQVIIRSNRASAEDLELFDVSGRSVKKIKCTGETVLEKSETGKGFFLVGSGGEGLNLLQKLLIY